VGALFFSEARTLQLQTLRKSFNKVHEQDAQSTLSNEVQTPGLVHDVNAAFVASRKAGALNVEGGAVFLGDGGLAV